MPCRSLLFFCGRRRMPCSSPSLCSASLGQPIAVFRARNVEQRRRPTSGATPPSPFDAPASKDLIARSLVLATIVGVGEPLYSLSPQLCMLTPFASSLCLAICHYLAVAALLCSRCAKPQRPRRDVVIHVSWLLQPSRISIGATSRRSKQIPWRSSAVIPWKSEYVHNRHIHLQFWPFAYNSFHLLPSVYKFSSFHINPWVYSMIFMFLDSIYSCKVNILLVFNFVLLQWIRN